MFYENMFCLKHKRKLCETFIGSFYKNEKKNNAPKIPKSNAIKWNIPDIPKKNLT